MAEEMQGCERCAKEFPIQTMATMEDCWFCEACVAEFQQQFSICSHSWEPHIGTMGDSGQYCSRCTGFVRNEDMQFTKKPE